MPHAEIISPPGQTPHHCPGCRRIINGFYHDAHDAPRPGDLSICVYCQHISVYAEDLSLVSVDLSGLEPSLRKYVEEYQQAIKDNPYPIEDILPPEAVPIYDTNRKDNH